MTCLPRWVYQWELSVCLCLHLCSVVFFWQRTCASPKDVAVIRASALCEIVELRVYAQSNIKVTISFFFFISVHLKWNSTLPSKCQGSTEVRTQMHRNQNVRETDLTTFKEDSGVSHYCSQSIEYTQWMEVKNADCLFNGTTGCTGRGGARHS